MKSSPLTVVDLREAMAPDPELFVTIKGPTPKKNGKEFTGRLSAISELEGVAYVFHDVN